MKTQEPGNCIPSLFKRTTIGLLLAAAGSLGVSASAQTVELDFWDMIWGPPEYIDSANEIVDRFNEEHPNITVEYRSVPWANWYQTFVAAIGAGTAPDISTGAGYQAVQLYELGAVMPIDDVVEELRAEGDVEDFQPGSVDTLQYDGHYVALPWGIDVRVWYYRKDLLEEAGVEPPTTWEELRAAGQELTGDGTYGFVGSGDTGGTHYLFTLMLNNGGGLFDEAGELDVTSERNMEAFEFFATLVEDGSFHPASAGYDSDGRRRAFAQGNAAFVLNNPGLADEFPEIADDIGILEPPMGPHGDRGTISWVNNIMLYNQTDHPEETKTFLKWWSRNQSELWTQGNSGQIPARQSITEDPYFQDHEARSFILDNYIPIGKTTATHASGIFPALNELEGEGVMQTLVQNLLQGNDVEDAVGRAEQRMQSIVQ